MGKYNMKNLSPKSDNGVSTVVTLAISGIDNKAFEPHNNELLKEDIYLECGTFKTEESLHHTASDEARVGSRVLEESENSDDGKLRQSKILTQVIAAVVLSVMQLGLGTIYGFPGVTLPELTNHSNQDLFLNTDQAANFVSMADLGGVFSCFLTAVLLVKLGQRVSILVFLPFAAAAWIAMGFSQNVVMLQAMRFLVGMCGGILLPAGGMYMLEISYKEFRGLLFGLVITIRQTGPLFVYYVGSLGLGWRYLSYICAGIALLPIVSLIFLPNSPRWLVTQGRKEDAEKSLIFFRGEGYSFKQEIKEITDEVEGNALQHNSFTIQVKMLLQAATLRYLVVISVLSFLTSFTGYEVLTAYVVLIFQAANVTVDAYLSAMLVAALRVAGTIVHLCIVDRMGRKPLLICSYNMCSLCLCALGGYFYFQDTNGDVSHFGWIPLASLVIFFFFSGVGQPVIFILQGELLPTSSRGAGISIVHIIVFLGSFIAIRTYSSITAVVGEHGAFWFYAGVCLTVSAIGYFCLPETKGRFLEDITDSLQQNCVKSDDRGNLN